MRVRLSNYQIIEVQLTSITWLKIFSNMDFSISARVWWLQELGAFDAR